MTILGGQNAHRQDCGCRGCRPGPEVPGPMTLEEFLQIEWRLSSLPPSPQKAQVAGALDALRLAHWPHFRDGGAGVKDV